MALTEDQVRKAEQAYRRSAARTDELREARNQLVREALAEGWTHAKIAALTGLSRGRISQFVA